MKRTPLRRHTRLERKTRIRQRARRVKPWRQARKDVEFLGWLHEQPCYLLYLRTPGHRCTGRLEADHVGADKGTGMKSDDRHAITLCSGAHRDRHERRGFFAGRSKEWMRRWCDEAIADHRARFLSAGSRRGDRR